ncbi:hypothetical protein TSOC_011627, partial [Tetrabaena socialis]
RASTQRRYFDSADWSLQKEGKLVPDVLLGFDCPIDQLPVRSEPLVLPARTRTHLNTVGWAQPSMPVAASRTVMDI